MVVSESVEIKGEKKIEGRFASFTLRTTSYYPAQKVQRRIAWVLYQIDLEKDGLLASQKYREDVARHRATDINVPLIRAPKVEGVFLLFLPEGKPAWGLMDIRKIESSRPEINLSLVSPLALMPHELHVLHGGIYEHKSQFSVIDKDGSQWTLHCDPL